MRSPFSGARLLLGQLYAQAADHDQAERLFREASDMISEGQSARVALAQLLNTRGDRRGTAVVLEPVLTADPGGFIDPWVDYLLGAGAGADLRDALRDEVRIPGVCKPSGQYPAPPCGMRRRPEWHIDFDQGPK